MAKQPIKKEKVISYLTKNPEATPAQVVKATGVTYSYAYKILKGVAEAKTRKKVKRKPAPVEPTVVEKPKVSIWRRIFGIG